MKEDITTERLCFLLSILINHQVRICHYEYACINIIAKKGIFMLTPNGRFAVNKRLCLSMSDCTLPSFDI